MNKHEVLGLIKLRGCASTSQLADFFNVAYTTAYTNIRRLKAQGLIRIYGKRGKEVFYEITYKGYNRLEYFEDNCPYEDCICREAKPR